MKSKNSCKYEKEKDTSNNVKDNWRDELNMFGETIYGREYDYSFWLGREGVRE